MKTWHKVVLWFGGFLLMWSLLLMSVGPVRAHDAPSGWHYPAECCGQGDCAQATFVGATEDGKMLVNTPIHSGVWPFGNPNVSVRHSPDSHVHLCATPDEIMKKYSDIPRSIYCVFMPDSN